MKLVVTKVNRTNRRWYTDLPDDHSLLKGCKQSLIKMASTFGVRPMQEMQTVVSTTSSYRVAGVKEVYYVSLKKLLDIPAERLTEEEEQLMRCLNSFQNQGVEGLLVGFAKEEDD